MAVVRNGRSILLSKFCVLLSIVLTLAISGCGGGTEGYKSGGGSEGNGFDTKSAYVTLIDEVGGLTDVKATDPITGDNLTTTTSNGEIQISGDVAVVGKEINLDISATDENGNIFESPLKISNVPNNASKIYVMGVLTKERDVVVANVSFESKGNQDPGSSFEGSVQANGAPEHTNSPSSGQNSGSISIETGPQGGSAVNSDPGNGLNTQVPPGDGAPVEGNSIPRSTPEPDPVTSNNFTNLPGSINLSGATSLVQEIIVTYHFAGAQTASYSASVDANGFYSIAVPISVANAPITSTKIDIQAIYTDGETFSRSYRLAEVMAAYGVLGSTPVVALTPAIGLNVPEAPRTSTLSPISEETAPSGTQPPRTFEATFGLNPATN